MGWELIIVIPLFLIAVAVINYFSTWGGQGYSDYQVDKYNEQAFKSNKIKWRKEVEFKLQNNLIREIPNHLLYNIPANEDDWKWQEEMERKYNI